MSLIKVAGDVLQGLADWVGAGEAVKQLVTGNNKDAEQVKKWLTEIKAGITNAMNNNNQLESKIYDAIFSLRNYPGLSSSTRQAINGKIKQLEQSRKQLQNNQKKYNLLDLEIDQAMAKTDKETLGDIAEYKSSGSGKNYYSKPIQEAANIGRNAKNTLDDLMNIEKGMNQK